MFQTGEIITAVRGENVQFCQMEYRGPLLSVPRWKSMKQPCRFSAANDFNIKAALSDMDSSINCTF